MLNNITNSPYFASQTAINGINNGFEQLGEYSNDINKSLVTPPNNGQANNRIDRSENYLDELNKPTVSSLEKSLVGSVQTQSQMQAMLKILQVEQQLFDNSLGKILNTQA